MKFVRAIGALTTGIVIAACGSDGGSGGSPDARDGGSDSGVGGAAGSGASGGGASGGGAKGIASIVRSIGKVSGAGTCADLLACCNATADTQFKQACVTEYNQAKPSGDAICGSLLASFKQAYCP